MTTRDDTTDVPVAAVPEVADAPRATNLRAPAVSARMTSPPVPSAAMSGATFASVVELRAAQARLGERRRHEASRGEFWDAVAGFVRRGCKTGVLLDNEDERWTIQGLLDYWAAALERAGRPRPDSSLVEFDPEQAPELPDSACPYLGLASFSEDNARLFFGRDALVDKLVQQLGKHRLIALVGPSGSGKSSLASAGLIGRLHRGALPGSEGWRFPPRMVPGAHPRAALASRIAGGDAPAVVVVDQFEELFTLCESEAERGGFVTDLLALVSAASPEHRVVLTVRSDFESLIARLPALYERYDAGRIAITPPSAVELRQAIEGPAALVGLKFEAGVVERLIQELLGEPAGLPLLQFTLLRLWEERHRNRVTMAAYERVGGGRQALARAADAVYDAMIPEDQATARRILLLVGLAVDDRHEPTRMRVPRAQFFAGGEDPGRVERVLDKLIAARLLRQTAGDDHAPEVEVSHEALVRNWPRLTEWLQEAQASLAERRRLEARAAAWVRRGRVRSGLLDAVEVREAERWSDSSAGKALAASPELLALIAASRRQVRLVARQRTAAIVGLAGLAIILASMLALVLQKNRVARDAGVQVSQSERQTRRLLGMSYFEHGRALLIDEQPPRPMRALPYLVAARAEGVDTPALRMLFAQASRNLPMVTFVGHAAGVNAAAYSPDGTRVVTAGDDHTARIWEATTGRSIGAPLEHMSTVSMAAFSADGTRVVTASLDHTARVWDAATGKPVTPPLAHQESVVAAAFSPDGMRVVTASFDKTARVWDAATGKPVTPPLAHDDVVQTVGWSPDGTRVVTASQDKTARVWDAATGKPLGEPLLHRDWVHAAAWSPDGTCIVTASEDNTARVWDAATGKPLGEPFEHRDGVVAAVFSPDGTRVVTASEDNTARVWEVGTWRAVTPPLEHRATVRGARFSPDGTRVVTASGDNTAQVWDATTGESLARLEHAGLVASAVFSGDGARVLTASEDRTARVWDVSATRPATLLDQLHELDPGHRAALAGRLGLVDQGDAAFASAFARLVAALGKLTMRELLDRVGIGMLPQLEHGDAVTTAAFSPDGKRVVTASDDHTARVWDAATRYPVTPPLTHEGGVNTAAFSRDGTRVMTASRDGTAGVWDAATGRSLTTLRGHQGAVMSAKLSPDGARVVTAGDDRTARVWDAVTGAQLVVLRHEARVNAAAFSPDGARVVTASSDWTARVWNAATGAQITPLLLHQGAVMAASFSPDGARVVTAGADSTARIWDATTGTQLRPPLAHQDAVYAASFSPDGARIVTASKDQTARVWSASDGTPITPADEHRGVINAAAFSPDGALVVTASEDKTARLLDAVTGKLIAPPLIHAGAVTAATFSPDGMRVVTASYDKTARIWPLNLDGRSLDAWKAVARCGLFVLVNGVLAINPEPLTRCESTPAEPPGRPERPELR